MNHIAVAEFHVHWAGWPIDDNHWTIAQNNVQDEAFIDEYNKKIDPYRNLELDVHVDVADLVYQEVEPKPKAKKKRNSKMKGVAQRRTSAKHGRPASGSDGSDHGTPAKRSKAGKNIPGKKRERKSAGSRAVKSGNDAPSSDRMSLPELAIGAEELLNSFEE